jgi:hypothetical protein
MKGHEINRRDLINTVAGAATGVLGLLLIAALPSAASAIQQDAEYLERLRSSGEINRLLHANID